MEEDKKFKEEESHIQKAYLELDDIADGVFVSGIDSCPNLDMPELMAYCRKKGIFPSELSKEEISRFNKE